jgi:16S rRNA processing protein RimM
MSSHAIEQPSPPDRNAVARILGVWGRLGHVKVESLSDIPDRFVSGARFLIGERAYVCEGSRPQGKTLLLKLQGINNRNDAAELQGSVLETPANEAPPLPEGTFYHYQIVGLEVWTSDGNSLGKVTDIISTGSNDVYVVQTAEGEVLIPATTDVVSQVDIDSGKITINVIPGLL